MADLPPPLPPAERTVGQLVAESIRAYGANFWGALPLGLPLAVSTELISGHSINTQVVVLWLLAPFFSAAYVRACVIVGIGNPPRGQLVFAWAIGTAVWLPAPVLLRLFVLPSVAWLALFGLAVPAAVAGTTGVRRVIKRARELARADYVHALGSLCTLVIVVALSGGVLAALLHGQGQTAQRVSVFLSLIVLSPLLYLGAALLYVDQSARVGLPRGRRRGANPPVAP
ncbi:MAG: hypothetical protein WCH31_07240 [Actinomycetes bacterium]